MICGGPLLPLHEILFICVVTPSEASCRCGIQGAVHIWCWACFSPREGEEESPHSVSQWGLLSLELLLYRM